MSGGYLEVDNNVVRVLADTVEAPGDIDLGRAQRAKDRALDRLGKKVEVDVQRAQASLIRANTRLAMSGSRRP